LIYREGSFKKPEDRCHNKVVGGGNEEKATNFYLNPACGNMEEKMTSTGGRIVTIGDNSGGGGGEMEIHLNKAEGLLTNILGPRKDYDRHRRGEDPL